MPRQLTTTKTSHEEWTHIFSVSIVIIPTHLLCQMQANSSGPEFLSAISKFSLLAEVSHDGAKMRERREVSLLSLIFASSWESSASREIQVHKEKENFVIACLRPSLKREIRHFNVVVVQRRQRNLQKSVMHVQSCCFALSSYCFFYFLVAASS